MFCIYYISRLAVKCKILPVPNSTEQVPILGSGPWRSSSYVLYNAQYILLNLSEKAAPIFFDGVTK